MNVIDLFCGCGGFSEGFRQAGHEIVLGFDIWESAVRVDNQNGLNGVLYDLNELDFKIFKGDCDILIGSPPCQEWSAGKNEKRTFDTSLIEVFQKAVKEIGPKYWVWECAKETAKLDGAKVLDAVDFGVPQHRKRAFHSNFELPEGKAYHLTVEGALRFNETKVMHNHWSLNKKAHSPVYLSNRPARTIVTWPPTIYKERKLSLEEVKVLMGFPKSYSFGSCSVSDAFKLLGNAVCPPVAKAIGEKLKGEAVSESAEGKVKVRGMGFKLMEHAGRKRKEAKK